MNSTANLLKSFKETRRSPLREINDQLSEKQSPSQVAE
jgi:hypothetical protein